MSFIEYQHRILPADLAKTHSVYGIYEIVVGHEDNVCCAGHFFGQQVRAGPRQLPQLHQVFNVQRLTIHIWMTAVEPIHLLAPVQGFPRQ